MDEPPHDIGVDQDGAARASTVVMRPRWWALPVTALGCLAFVVAGVALIASGGNRHIAIGVLSIAFFGGGLVLLAGIERRPAVSQTAQ